MKYGFKYLKKLNSDCHKRGIKLILVYALIFVSIQRSTPQMDSVIFVLKKIAKQENFQFWDYSKDTLSFNHKYFHDYDHLNKLGAEDFTKQFASDMKAFILKDRDSRN